MSLVKVTMEINENGKQRTVEHAGDGALCLIMNRDGMKQCTMGYGLFEWDQVARCLLLCGMPKWPMIKAILFGAKGIVTDARKDME
jgi:hypothetical protein